MARGRVQWNLVSKHHAFQHYEQVIQVINPRLLATYTEESMMKTGTRLYSVLAHGQYADRIQHQVLSRYLTALELQWSGIV
jgi:hypothetical protein